MMVKMFGVEIDKEVLKAKVEEIAEQWERLDPFEKDWYDDYEEYEEMTLHEWMYPEE